MFDRTVVKMKASTVKITRAKRIAESRMPYLASLLWQSRAVEKPEIGTMAVDQHGRLYYAPEFVESLTEEECAFVLLHEMLHIALSHAKRRQRRVPNPTAEQAFAWNIAADISINEMLQKDASDLTPDSAVRLRQYRNTDYRFEAGMSTEQYYELLVSQDEEQRRGGNRGDGGEGDSPSKQDGDSQGNEKDDSQSNKSGKSGGSSADGLPREYEDEPSVSDVIGQEGRLLKVEEDIATYEKQVGSAPGGLKQSLTARLHPMPDPFDQLRSAVSRSVSSPLGEPVSTYRRLNRRQQSDMPRRRGEQRYAPECVIVVDTSGSMDAGTCKEKALNAVAKGLRRVQRPRVVCADGKVQSVKHITSMKSFEWVGGGGTSMDKAVEFADKEYRPDAIVLVTDGYTEYPKKSTRARLVVGLVANGDEYYKVPSWAKAIRCYKEVNVDAG